MVVDDAVATPFGLEAIKKTFVVGDVRGTGQDEAAHQA